MEDTLTVEQALQITYDLLGNIEVPMKYRKQIANPIATAMANLEMIIAAVKESNETEAKKNAESDSE